ncbi:MAG: DNA repair protein RecN [Bacteroidales bacterium]|nr:DNA repair protein RecN [Bacteroidales bacterium]
MLTHLHIENYALIRESDIAFGPGFVAITGETGAGKSILLGALGLLLGQRADAAVLADKGKKCVVEARFDIAGLALQPLFDEADVDYDDTLILRREILPSAKSRAFANDTPVQLPFLKALGARIIDIHSQHQTLTLADSHFRLSLLDTIGGGKERDRYADAYRHYSRLKRELEELTAAEAQNRKEQDYLQFQFNELQEAQLHADEQESLEQESQLLSHAEAVREGLATAARAVDDETEQSVLARLRGAKSALAHVAPYHPQAEELLKRLESSLIELDDIGNELRSAADGVTYSPERQQAVDERLALLYRLQKKHGVDTVADLVALREELDARLQGISTLDERIQALMEQVDQAFSALQKEADRLTTARTKAARLLEKNILPTLHELGMPEARFEVRLEPTPTYGPTGHDAAAFLFNANRGGDLRDLAKVASGGELSRLMLAVKSMLTSHSLLPTIIFDEIDTGVSGDISVAVGRIMCRMAERMQVVAITHLPQIAAKAGQHLKVYKQLEDSGQRTVSRIRGLTGKERLTEVAVMLSSDPPTPAALQTAKELMQP